MARYFELEKSKGRALILYNFELKNLRDLLGCEEATRAMAHYHPSPHLVYANINTELLLPARASYPCSKLELALMALKN